MVDDVTEVGGVPAVDKSDDDEWGEPPATKCAPNWLVMSCDCWQLLLSCCCRWFPASVASNSVAVD